MPAHDTPYVELAGGQNAEAFSVVKAVSMGPIAGDGLAGGMPPRAGHHWRVVARHPGAGQVPRCRVRRRPSAAGGRAVSQPVPATGVRAGCETGPGT